MAFFSVTKANARIVELEAQLGAAQAANKELTDANEAASKAPDDLQARLDQSVADLATARQSISSQGEQIKAKDAEITKLQADHKTTIDALEASVEQRASAKALTITQGQGQPPLAAIPKEQPGNPAKQDFSKLHGLDRVEAALRARYETQ